MNVKQTGWKRKKGSHRNDLWLMVPAVLCTLGVFVLLPMMELFSREPDKTYDVRPVEHVELPPVKKPLQAETMDKTDPMVAPIPMPAVQPVVPIISHESIRQVALNALSSYDVSTDWALDFGFEIPSSSDGIFAVGELDQSPQSLVQMRPVYPLRARNRRIEGYVLLEYVVTKEGRVEQARVIESSPQGVFEQAALRSTKTWQFEPGRKHGRAVDARIEQKLTFALQD